MSEIRAGAGAKSKRKNRSDNTKTIALYRYETFVLCNLNALDVVLPPNKPGILRREA